MRFLPFVLLVLLASCHTLTPSQPIIDAQETATEAATEAAQITATATDAHETATELAALVPPSLAPLAAVQVAQTSALVDQAAEHEATISRLTDRLALAARASSRQEAAIIEQTNRGDRWRRVAIIAMIAGAVLALAAYIIGKLT
jgi:outer membrane PBP1 activator LpoA protein